VLYEYRLTNELLSFSWAENCAVQPDTNGVDFNAVTNGPINQKPRVRLPAQGNLIQVDNKPASAVGLPPEFFPTVPIVAGGSGSVIQSYILPDNKTGVVSASLRFLYKTRI
jgi:hypothetical protein